MNRKKLPKLSSQLKLEYITDLSKYERGISIPSLELAEKIATAFKDLTRSTPIRRQQSRKHH